MFTLRIAYEVNPDVLMDIRVQGQGHRAGQRLLAQPIPVFLGPAFQLHGEPDCDASDAHEAGWQPHSERYAEEPRGG